jgi:hypothetical protein
LPDAIGEEHAVRPTSYRPWFCAVEALADESRRIELAARGGRRPEYVEGEQGGFRSVAVSGSGEVPLRSLACEWEAAASVPTRPGRRR